MAELKNVVVDAISLVKAGANGEPIQIYKSAEGAAESAQTNGTSEAIAETPATSPEDAATAQASATNEAEVEKSTEITPAPIEQPSEAEVSAAAIDKAAQEKSQSFLKDLFAPIIKAFTGQDVTEKSADIDNSFDPTSFTSRMTQPESQLDEAIYQLMYSFWCIFWDDNIENGKERILKNIDDFKAYVESILDGPRDRAEAFFEKGEEGMFSPETITKAVQEAVAPLQKSVDELSEKVKAAEEEATPATPAEGTEPEGQESAEPEQKSADDAQAMAEAISKAVRAAVEPLTKSVEDLGGRIQRIETTKGISKGAGDPKTPSAVEKGVADEWPDIHIPGLG